MPFQGIVGGSSPPNPHQYVIYKTTCLVNGKFYIGKHKTSNLNDGYIGSGKLLLADVGRLGSGCFVTEVLLVLDSQRKANLAERILVVIDPEISYNLLVGGGGDFSYINSSGIAKFRGKRHTKETKLKIAEASRKRKGFKFSEQQRRRVSEGLKLRYKVDPSFVNRKRCPRLESTKMKISQALLGRKHSEITKQKMRDAWRNRKLPSANG